MTNARLSVVKPSISPSLRLPSRLEVGACARPGWMCSQCAPSWRGKGGVTLFFIPTGKCTARASPARHRVAIAPTKGDLSWEDGGRGAKWFTQMQNSLLVKSNGLELCIFPFSPWWLWEAAPKLPKNSSFAGPTHLQTFELAFTKDSCWEVFLFLSFFIFIFDGPRGFSELQKPKGLPDEGISGLWMVDATFHIVCYIAHQH